MFLRTGLPGGRERLLEAKRGNVTQTSLCTMLGDASGASVCTVEHLLAALSGLRIDNVLIEIDGPETPIMDGSAADFVSAIDQVGVAQQSPLAPPSQDREARARRSRRRLCRVSARRTRIPARCRDRLRIAGDRPPAARFDLDPATFRREIARARTFGFVSDVQKLWQAGYALGSSLDNSVAIDGDIILNPEGLRYADEFVRHKALDAIGDLSLAGAPIVGLYRTYRPGHKLNALALEALFASRSAYEIVEAPTAKASVKGFAAGAHVPAGAVAFAARRLILAAFGPPALSQPATRCATIGGHLCVRAG